MDNNQLANNDDPFYSCSGLIPTCSMMATMKKNKDPLWAKVATLEASIAAVEREQEMVEAAMLRSHDSSSLDLPNRIGIRGLLVGTATTTTDDRQVSKKRGPEAPAPLGTTIYSLYIHAFPTKHNAKIRESPVERSTY